MSRLVPTQVVSTAHPQKLDVIVCGAVAVAGRGPAAHIDVEEDYALQSGHSKSQISQQTLDRIGVLISFSVSAWLSNLAALYALHCCEDGRDSTDSSLA
jgi:hypothetical protein